MEMEVDAEHHAPSSQERAGKQNETENLKRVPNESSGSGGASLEVQLHIMDETQTRESVEEPTRADPRDGRVCVHCGGPDRIGDADGEEEGNALGPEAKVGVVFAAFGRGGFEQTHADEDFQSPCQVEGSDQEGRFEVHGSAMSNCQQLLPTWCAPGL